MFTSWLSQPAKYRRKKRHHNTTSRPRQVVIITPSVPQMQGPDRPDRGSNRKRPTNKEGGGQLSGFARFIAGSAVIAVLILVGVNPQVASAFLLLLTTIKAIFFGGDGPCVN